MWKRTWRRYGVLLLIAVALLSTFSALWNEEREISSKIKDEIASKGRIPHYFRNEAFDNGVPVHNTDNVSTEIWFNKPSELQKRTMIDVAHFRRHPNMKTGNPLIDEYSDIRNTSHITRNDLLALNDGINTTFLTELETKYQINVLLSDKIPLNRHVLDSRVKGCSKLTYEHDLPTASIIIPFYDEWYSILLRTLYSIVNRTPRHLLQEIILVDDNSTMDELKDKLDDEISRSFPTGLVKVVRNRERQGLIKCRIEGWKHATGDVIVFFDSHMEVNIDWLQPLLTEIKKDRTTVAMSTLDYINRHTFEYTLRYRSFTRYGFAWTLAVFETYSGLEDIGDNTINATIGAVIVGAACAIDRKFFEYIGLYDEGMDVWGGENLEMSWRVWQCGGRLIHVPCSHVGHIARAQPYSFPGGRHKVEVHNYKRAVDVWMEEPIRRLVYNHFPEMRHMDVGDLSSRRALKKRLKCKSFSWYIDKVWPHLTIFNRNAFAWGSVMNNKTAACLDTHNYVFFLPKPLYIYPCHFYYSSQGFSLSNDNVLRSSLQCVALRRRGRIVGSMPYLTGCWIKTDLWEHTKGGHIKHIASGLCLSVSMGDTPVMAECKDGAVEQNWTFTHYS